MVGAAGPRSGGGRRGVGARGWLSARPGGGCRRVRHNDFQDRAAAGLEAVSDVENSERTFAFPCISFSESSLIKGLRPRLRTPSPPLCAGVRAGAGEGAGEPEAGRGTGGRRAPGSRSARAFPGLGRGRGNRRSTARARTRGRGRRATPRASGRGALRRTGVADKGCAAGIQVSIFKACAVWNIK
jgi:hypothetical protein